MAITLRSVLDGGGSSPMVCNLQDGMLSDSAHYLTVPLTIPLEQGKVYWFSYKATSGSTPDSEMKYKYNGYVFKYNGGTQNISFGNGEFKVTVNSLQCVNYGGAWYYVWGRIYGGVEYPSDVDY